MKEVKLNCFFTIWVDHILNKWYSNGNGCGTARTFSDNEVSQLHYTAVTTRATLFIKSGKL